MQAITPEALQPAPAPRTPTLRQPVAPAPAPPPEADPAAITLRLPEGDRGDPGSTLAVGVEPGGRARAIALVRNQSGIVDNFELSVLGLPDDWWSIFPGTVYLVPFGTSGTYEQEVEIHLHPPRTAEAEARIWDLQVAGHSRAHGRQAAAAPLKLGIQPFEEFTTKLSPERVSGRRKARYEVAIRNTANAPVTVALDAADQDDELAYKFTPATLEIAPGQSSRSKLLVRPPRQRWIGRPLEKRIQVFTNAGRAEFAADIEPPVDEDRAGLPQALPRDRAARAGRHQRRARAGPARLQAGDPEQERRPHEAQGARRGRRAAGPADAQPGRLPPQGLAALVDRAADPAGDPAGAAAVPVPSAQRRRPRRRRREVGVQGRAEADGGATQARARAQAEGHERGTARHGDRPDARRRREGQEGLRGRDPRRRRERRGPGPEDHRPEARGRRQASCGPADSRSARSRPSRPTPRARSRARSPPRTRPCGRARRSACSSRSPRRPPR